MSSYFQALLFLTYALPVSSVGPLFTDVPQDAGIAFINFGLRSATAAAWASGERQTCRAVPTDRHYVIYRGVNRLMPE